MTQYNKGQDVEIWGANMYQWRKAKIVDYEPYVHGAHEPDRYSVQFSDGPPQVFAAKDIRPLTSDPEGFNQSVRNQLMTAMARGPHAKVNGLEI